MREVTKNRVVDLVFVVVLMAVIFPFSVSQNAWGEWANSFFFFTERWLDIRQGDLNLYFVHSYRTGVFYPLHVFYGGFTTLIAAATLIWLPPFFGFVFTCSISYLLLYVGTRHVAEALGAEPLVARICAFTAALSPYMITQIYGRGSWAELVGSSVSVFTLGLIARALRTSSPPTRRLIVAISLGTALSIATHNLTVLLTIAVLLPITGLLLLTHTYSRDSSRFYNVKSLFAAVTTGLLIPQIFVLPNFLYGRLTDVAQWNSTGTGLSFAHPGIVLNPLLTFPAEQQEIHRLVFGSDVEVRLFNQTNILLLLLSFATALVAIATKKSRSAAPLVILAVPISLLILEITSGNWIVSRPWSVVQFPYRLTTYIGFFVAVCSAVVLSRIGLPTVARLVSRAFLMLLLLFTSSTAIFQANTGVATSPPNYQEPIVKDVSSGKPPPLFAGNTAAPIQFRFSQKGPRSGNRTLRLNFGPHGGVLDTTEIQLEVQSRDEMLGVTIPVVQTGRSGAATTLGIRRSPIGSEIVLDRWGYPPLQRSIRRISSEGPVSITVVFDWALGTSTVRADGIHLVTAPDLITDQPGTFLVGKNPAGSSLVIARARDVKVRNVRIVPSRLSTGQYSTNVVWSPFTNWSNAVSAGMTDDGMWNIEIGENEPSVRVSLPFPSVVGMALSFLGVVLLIGFLIRWPSTYVEDRHAKWRRDPVLNLPHDRNHY